MFTTKIVLFAKIILSRTVLSLEIFLKNFKVEFWRKKIDRNYLLGPDERTEDIWLESFLWWHLLTVGYVIYICINGPSWRELLHCNGENMQIVKYINIPCVQCTVVLHKGIETLGKGFFREKNKVGNLLAQKESLNLWCFLSCRKKSICWQLL